MWQPLPASVQKTQFFGETWDAAPDIAVPVFGLQVTLFRALNRLARSVLRQVPGLLSHGPESLDWQDLHGSTVLDKAKGGTGSQKMEV